jgi:DNA-binding XRE family transcriptional regulator
MKKMNKNDLAARIRRARKSLEKNGQQGLLLEAREAFGLTNQELAEALGVSLDTLLAYLSADTAQKHRNMPELDKRALAQVLAEMKKK